MKDIDEIQDILGVLEEYVSIAILAIEYPGEIPVLRSRVSYEEIASDLLL